MTKPLPLLRTQRTEVITPPAVDENTDYGFKEFLEHLSKEVQRIRSEAPTLTQLAISFYGEETTNPTTNVVRLKNFSASHINIYAMETEEAYKKRVAEEKHRRSEAARAKRALQAKKRRTTLIKLLKEFPEEATSILNAVKVSQHAQNSKDTSGATSAPSKTTRA